MSSVRIQWKYALLNSICVLLLAVTCVAQTEPIQTAAPSPQVLTQPDDQLWLYDWKYHPGDDLRWAAPDFDDNAWKSVNLKTSTSPIGLGWYRATVFAPRFTDCNIKLGMIVSHTTSRCAFEAYVNGQKVGQFGELTPQPIFPSRRVKAPFSVPLPEDSKGRLVIAIRIWENSSPVIANGKGFTGVSLAGFSKLNSNIQEGEVRALQSAFWHYGIALAFAFFAIYHLYFYVTLRLYGRQNEQPEYLWLGLSALGYALNSVTLSSELMLNYVSIVAFSQLNIISIQYLIIVGIQFIYSFLKRTLPKVLRWIQLASCSVILGTIIFPEWFLYSPVRNLIFAASISITVSFIGVFMFREARRGNKQAKLLILAFSIVIFAETIQVVRSIVRQYVSQTSNWWNYAAWTTYLVEVSFGCILITMAVAVARRYRDELEAANRNLEQVVIERTAEVRQQRDKLEQKNQDIEDSLRYAQTMQRAVLPDVEILQQVFTETFVLWRPRDIVSGDFYWFHKTAQYCIVAVADCTGHGIPGAFMSFIGNDLLNQIVVEHGVNDPAQILAELDANVQRALKQGNQGSTSVNDGMDIGICRFDANGICFAGARRPLYVVTDGELTEYPGVRHPIGGQARKPRRFENVTVPISLPMTLYLTTDGFADQPDVAGKRFKIKPFLNLLIDIAGQSSKQQRDALENALAQHQGDAPQRDDITVVGLCLRQHYWNADSLT